MPRSSNSIYIENAFSSAFQHNEGGKGKVPPLPSVEEPSRGLGNIANRIAKVIPAPVRRCFAVGIACRSALEWIS